MKVIKYGTGMKCKRHYITECGNCHTIFDASPKEVEFLGRNDECVEYPTPTYRTYCPVCGDTRIYEIKKKKKKKKSSAVMEIMFIILILLPIIDMCCECIPGDVGLLVRMIIGIVILILAVIVFLYAIQEDI